MDIKQLPWYMNAIFYEVQIKAFCDSNKDGIGDMPGLISKLDYIKGLGVDCVWILPIYPSPMKDDGYDIADYYNIHPNFGNLTDFKNLIDEAHKRGLRVIADLVLNHTSDQHPWFQKSRNEPNSKYRNYYVWSKTNQKYTDARIIFLDTEESNWTFDQDVGMYYWHRFYSSQPDLNYDNPAVIEEMQNIMKFWLDMGIDGFRADAVPYLIEREGTNCENLPETHQILKGFRAYLDEHYIDKVLLAEANQWPKDVLEYFGDGDEFHMGFHFPVMPRVFMAIKRGDASPIQWIMSQTPNIPETTQWCTFLRNHDELTLEMVTEEEREWMWKEYAPDPRMRLNLGIRRRLAPLLDNDQRKILLANVLIFSLPGAPIIYYGDEIGMGDNIWLPDRNGVRTPMQWNDGLNAGFSEAKTNNLFAPVIDDDQFSYKMVNVEKAKANPNSILNQLTNLIKIRKSHPIFALGDYEFLAKDKKQFLVILRTYQDQAILCLTNLTKNTQDVQLKIPQFVGKKLINLINTENPIQIKNEVIHFSLPPYGYYWLKIED